MRNINNTFLCIALLYIFGWEIWIVSQREQIRPTRPSTLELNPPTENEVEIAFVPKQEVEKKKITPPWNRWKEGSVSIVSLNLMRITAIFSNAPQAERCEKTRNRFSSDLKMRVGVVTTGQFFDPRTTNHNPVGGEIRKDGIVTKSNHSKPRRYLTAPKPGTVGKISVVETWQEVLENRKQICAIQLGPTVFPRLEGGLNEPNWETRRTERYVYATRGQYEGLVLYFPNASPRDIWWFCYRKLRVDFAALLDGSSSIRYGTKYHIVFALPPKRPKT